MTSQLLHAYRLEMPEKVEGMKQLEGKVVLAPLPKKFEELLERERV